MSQDSLKQILIRIKDHETRIHALENVGAKNLPKTSLANNRNRPKARGKGENLLPPIQALVQNGFFKEAKLDLDVVYELQKRLLTRKKPLRASVVNVLRRMVRDSILERVNIIKNKKTLIAYQNNS